MGIGFSSLPDDCGTNAFERMDDLPFEERCKRQLIKADEHFVSRKSLVVVVVITPIATMSQVLIQIGNSIQTPILSCNSFRFFVVVPFISSRPIEVIHQPDAKICKGVVNLCYFMGNDGIIRKKQLVDGLPRVGFQEMALNEGLEHTGPINQNCERNLCCPLIDSHLAKIQRLAKAKACEKT